MSVSAVHSRPTNLYLNPSTIDQSAQMIEAIHNQDFTQLRDLFLQQQDFNQTVKISGGDLIQLTLLVGLKDPEFARDFCLEMLGDVDDEELQLALKDMVDQITGYVTTHPSFTDALFPAIVKVMELALKNLPAEDVQELELIDDAELTYFEIACTLNDEELVRHALENQSDLELKSLDLLTDPCTSMRRNIFEIILSYGYGIEDLLSEGQTINDVMIEAVEDGNKNLLLFLKDHGYNTTEYLELLA